MGELSFFPITGLGEIAPGGDLPALLYGAMVKNGLTPRPGDLLVVAHKIISKAEGRMRRLSEVAPGEAARRLAEAAGKEPELVELILEESEEVYACHSRGVLIGKHRLGWSCANAGIDRSNAPEGQAVLLPLDPDGSARRLGEGLERLSGTAMPVLVSDTQGRPLREGIIGVAVGCWGLEAVKNYAGQQDRFGRPLRVSREAVADELCSAATLCMGQAGESVPAVLVRGYAYCPGGGSAPLKRPAGRELYRPCCDSRTAGFAGGGKEGLSGE